MKAKPFTEQEKQFIRDNFAAMTIRQMAIELNRSEGGVKTWSLKLGLRRRNRFDWTEEKIEILNRLYFDTETSEIAKILNAPITAIWYKAARLGLKKSVELIAEVARKKTLDPNHGGKFTRFRKGMPAWNKGKKIGSYGRSAETQFKKGVPSRNSVPIGTELINTDGYWKVKIAAPNVWKEKHRLIWEEKHGEIPKGMCLVFKDRNSKNCVYENLELITRQQLMLRNAIHNYPEDLKITIMTLGRLKRRIRKNAEK